MVHGKPDKAEKVIRTIAWFNRRDPPKVSGTASNTLAHSNCYATRNTREIVHASVRNYTDHPQAIALYV